MDELLQYKCNLCYDRTSEGLAPMCATVCPTEAIWFGTLEELERKRPGVRVTDRFAFGDVFVQTGCAMVVSPAFDDGAAPGGM